MENRLTHTPEESYDLIVRKAKALAASTMIPKDYQNNVANTLVALEMAHRIGASPLMVMQNLHIIHGRPSWSSTFIIAALNACGRFTALRFEATEDKCRAVATERDTGAILEGPWVTIQMAKDEGWLTKAGSKWKTMPELMLKYRSAAFFGRLYAPEIMMGMHTEFEVQDVQPVTVSRVEALLAPMHENPLSDSSNPDQSHETTEGA
jgi:hypothetical protein